MANIGATTAFYKVETSLTRANNEVSKSMERLATGRQNANAGDRSSYVAMADTFRLDYVGTKAGIKGASELGALGTGERTGRADGFKKREGGMVAAQQKMVTVIDAPAEHVVMVRTAAPAGMAGRFVQGHGNAGLGQPDRGGKAGQSGADDVDAGCVAHSTP